MTPVHLMEGFGLELELMLVARDGLDPLPVADQLLAAAAREPGALADCEADEAVDDVEFGPLGWSNELVLHVVEFKTLGPVAGLAGLAAGFQEQVGRANRLLKPLGGRLLPGAMHPWLDPLHDTRLWPHGHREIYAAYDRIFGCKGHGWSNLQSLHLNLAFAGDAEFARLHAATRLVLPLLPALAASSPMLEGAVGPWLDNRLAAYRLNQVRIPSIAGELIPEPVWSRRDYEEQIFARIWSDIAPFDPDKLLRKEWLNSRGAIARYDRNALEIRLIDTQECPRADVAVAAGVIQALANLIEEKWTPLAAQQALGTGELADLLWTCCRDGENASVANPRYLACFGLARPISAGDLWQQLLGTRNRLSGDESRILDLILEQGPLARRILKAAGPDPSRTKLRRVYERLADCLEAGELFLP